MDRVVTFDAIAIDCSDPLELARFWAAMLGTEIGPSVGDGPHYVELAPTPGVPTLRFQRVPEPKATKNRLHLELSVEDMDQAYARVEALGGRRVSREPLIEYGYTWSVMQDPEGNEFCIGPSPDWAIA